MGSATNAQVSTNTKRCHANEINSSTRSLRVAVTGSSWKSIKIKVKFFQLTILRYNLARFFCFTLLSTLGATIE
jgi:hypothetical protein